MNDTYTPFNDREIAAYEMAGDSMPADILEQVRRANALAAAVVEMEREFANPVPCHVMRKQTREKVFRLAAYYRGETP